MELFMEVDQAQHSSFLQEWRLNGKMRRDGRTPERKLESSSKHDESGDVLGRRDDSAIVDNKDVLEVSDCGVKISDVNEEEAELVSKDSLFIESDTGIDSEDRNLEMVKLLRRKNDKKRSRPEILKKTEKKKQKTSNMLVDDWSNLLSNIGKDVTKEKDKKKEKKRKKKSKKKKKADDILDDIFN
jgi:hypothetical protein